MTCRVNPFVILGTLLVAFFTWRAQVCHGDVIRVLVNHIGYEKDGPKHAVIQGRAGDQVQGFKVLDAQSGAVVFLGDTVKVGAVDQWKDWIFWTADFTPVQTEGTYILECATGSGAVRSYPFAIQHNLLERNTLSNVVSYFKAERCSGLLDDADAMLPFEGHRGNLVDAHGGWYDATGDYGKHLSHLSFSTYFNPQQIPLADWSLFKTYEQLTQRDDPNFREYRRRLLDEARFGADYLARVKNPKGSFYRSVDAPGGEKKPEDRRIGKEGQGFAIKTLQTKNKSPNEEMKSLSVAFPYEVGYRNGGGMVIAALALARNHRVPEDSSSEAYSRAAHDAFNYLEQHNLQYANDGQENIVDDYCALLAATELFRTTDEADYKAAAERRAKNLLNRLISSGKYANYWRADEGDRPFFHAADAGLPVVSLLNFYPLADDSLQKEILAAVRKAMEFELHTTDEVPNPFGYARQLVQSTDGDRRTAFFFPHDTETAPWWQGENARLASLAAAARLTARCFKDDRAFHDRLLAYATNQLNWILGLNPYDACMLHGSGHNNPAYMFFDSYQYTNTPGGICNGITSGYKNPHDIDFNLSFAVTGKDEDWRWSEQWLPHAAWYLYAISLGE
ncbi:MAG TPA: glycoside hydrolase family 9 protein [Pirellulales bacterium]|jgi:hypothetical protein|nr:glycoside hydrolase family 9 protein [Pirellulales bacterium]